METAAQLTDATWPRLHLKTDQTQRWVALQLPEAQPTR
jgi:hypothetical protein